MEVLLESGVDRVALVRINRPEARNALNNAVREQLAQTFLDLADNDEVRCVILTGTENVFSAGAKIKAMADAQPFDMIRRATERNWAPLKNFPKPLIAAVDGSALGGGCELAMHADMIVAGESVKFAQPELKVRITPGAGGNQRLVRAVGNFKAMKLLLTGELIAAREAEAMGLVAEVVPDDEVLDRALALARAVSCLPPLAGRKIKESVRQGSGLSLKSALMMERPASRLMFATADHKEGMRAFIEKRSPNFVGL
jgi:enoyl-CoA hydratase/carnithine racemase